VQPRTVSQRVALTIGDVRLGQPRAGHLATDVGAVAAVEVEQAAQLRVALSPIYASTNAPPSAGKIPAGTALVCRNASPQFARTTVGVPYSSTSGPVAAVAWKRAR
jgi:hypothetical protein